ncbi:MAG: hypothetical protein IJI22_04300 [Bacilli bacterium]|nr:hypothetical protein [Bacilli bacterium]
MFSDTFLASKNVLNSSFRWIIINIDHAVYGLLELIYQLFFNVASSDFFSNATVVKFYGRVQLILGIFMMFQLAMIILKGIVNPDSFTDKKSGAGNLVTRVITALVLLTVLVPINVPKDPASMNEYEIQINNNGLLFGTLYSLQYRLLAGNVLGKLILGTTESDTFDISENEDGLYDSAKTFTATIVRGFYRINLIPYEERTHDPDKDDAEIVSNRMCEDMGDALGVYTSPDSSAGEIIAVANETCSENKILGLLGKTVSAWAGNEMYMFTIMPFVSTAAAIIFILIFISFTIDVAVRAIKLAVLRLIAPIPIISYMDPKGSKDSAFNAWVKSLTSTYLDLFVRLATIYFVLFIIRDMISNGIVVGGSGLLKTLSIIAIWIGLFVFAKQAPKFIRQILGLKEDAGKGIFSGLGAAMAVGAMAGGVTSGALSRAAASKQNGGKFFSNVGAGIVGAIGGGVNSGRAFFGSDKANRKSVMEQRRAYNARNYSNAADDSTFKGRFAASMASNLGLRNKQEKLDTKQAYYNAANDAWSRMDAALSGDDKYKTKGKTIGDAFSATKQYSVKEASDIYTAMKNSGKYSVAELREAEEYVKEIKKDTYGKIIKDRKNKVKLDSRGEQIYGAAETIFKVGSAYSNDADEIFVSFKGKDKLENVDYGDLKGGSLGAKREADKIKASSEYAAAKADAARVAQNNKK